MKKTESTKVTNVFNELHSKENEKDGEGYVSADDLCRILELSEKEVFPKLSNHLYTVILEGASDKQQKMPFVDENGLYMMFLLSKKKDAIRFQEWLHGEFLQALYDQRKALAGLKKDVKLVAEPDLQRQALRYMATAKNVEKSGHFIVGKDIPVTCVSGSSISMMTVLSIGPLIRGCQAMPSWTIRFSTIFWRRLLLMKMSWIRRMLILWFS